jgi:hypothetical protein
MGMKITTTVLVFACLGLLLAQPANSVKSAAPAPHATTTGRYQIVFSPHVRADAFLLDTETGRTWQWVQYTDVPGTPTVWTIRQRFDSPAELAAWYIRENTPAK